jgi:site-specific DNA-methyltransferase (adenine-specific)
MKTETAWQLITDDCLNALPTIEESSIDACVTDPPYGLNMMGKNWDYGVPGVAYWKEVLRVLKPGTPLLAFGGTRTHHRLMTAIEDAGFELRDCLCWLFGSGFPKSLNISKAIDKAAGAERKITGADPDAAKRNKTTSKFSNLYGNINDKMSCPITAPATAEAKLWDGWGSALKPAYEPIILAMKPLDGTYAHNALTHGVAGLNIDGCRIATTEDLNGGAYRCRKEKPKHFGGLKNKVPEKYQQPQGRWPANVILDEEAGKLLDEQTGTLTSGTGAIIKESAPNRQGNTSTAFGAECRPEGTPIPSYGDSGGASRFFYCAKTSRSERTNKGTITNDHPTVKPLALMQWLCRLVSTPTGGTILDPFAGSGSTGVAAMKEGLNFVGIEKEEAYAEIARRRLAAAQPVPRHRQASLFDLIGGLD